MEVVVDQDKPQRGKSRTGTLENPESYENVPGHAIPIIEREFDDFDNEAEKFLSGELDVEAWLTSPLSTAELIKEMRGVKGVGPYAAENLLKLLGRYDGLALDSWSSGGAFGGTNEWLKFDGPGA